MRVSKFVIAKYLLVFINLSFALLGAAMLAIGLAQKESLSGELGVFYGSVTLFAPMVLICTGTVLFLVAILGSLATLAENYWALVWFGTTLGCAILIQSVAGASSLVISSNMRLYLHNALEYEVLNYERNPRLMDRLQLGLNCCGANGYYEWYTLFGCVPSSCCPDSVTDSATTAGAADHYQTSKAIVLPQGVFRYWPPTKAPLPITETFVNRAKPDKPIAASKDVPEGKRNPMDVKGGGHPAYDDEVVDKMDDSALKDPFNGDARTEVNALADTTEAYIQEEPIVDVKASLITRGPLLDWSDMLFRGLRRSGEEGHADDGSPVVDRKTKRFRTGVKHQKTSFRKAEFCTVHGREISGNRIQTIDLFRRLDTSQCIIIFGAVMTSLMRKDFLKDGYCPDLYNVGLERCNDIVSNIASDDAFLAGVAALIMAALQLVGIPLCYFMVTFIKEFSRQDDRMEILTASAS